MRAYLLFISLLAVLIAVAGNAAPNAVSDGNVITATWSSTSARSGEPVLYGTVASGAFVGVALNGRGIPNEQVSVALRGVFSLWIDPVATMAIGAPVYITGVGGATSTATLTDQSSNALVFGRVLSVVPAAGATVSVVLEK